jgi:hypothetical protein
MGPLLQAAPPGVAPPQTAQPTARRRPGPCRCPEQARPRQPRRCVRRGPLLQMPGAGVRAARPPRRHPWSTAMQGAPWVKAVLSDHRQGPLWADVLVLHVHNSPPASPALSRPTPHFACARSDPPAATFFAPLPAAAAPPPPPLVICCCSSQRTSSRSSLFLSCATGWVPGGWGSFLSVTTAQAQQLQRHRGCSTFPRRARRAQPSECLPTSVAETGKSHGSRPGAAGPSCGRRTCRLLTWQRSRSTVSRWRAAAPRASSRAAASCASRASMAERSFLVGSWGGGRWGGGSRHGGAAGVSLSAGMSLSAGASTLRWAANRRRVAGSPIRGAAPGR